MAWVFYGSYKGSLVDQADVVDWDDNSTTTVKIALVTSAYTPAVDTHDFWNDVSANEVSGTNYTAGGNAVANKTVTGPSSGTITVDSDDPATWSQDAGGFSNARYAILYKDTGTATTSPLIGYYDLGSDQGNVSGDLTLSLSTVLFTVS